MPAPLTPPPTISKSQSKVAEEGLISERKQKVEFGAPLN
jgi:hypothetical protein